MSLYQELDPVFQQWIETAVEIAENPAGDSGYEKISYHMLLLAALKTASSELRQIFSANMLEGLNLTLFTTFLEENIRLAPKGQATLEGADDDFDTAARELLQRLIGSSGEVSGWLTIFQNPTGENFQLDEFFAVTAIIHEFKHQLLDEGMLQKELFPDGALLDSALFSEDGLQVIESAALKAAIARSEYILPVHLLAAILHFGHPAIETLIRKNMVPSASFPKFMENIDSYLRLLDTEAAPLPLALNSFSQYCADKLVSAYSLMRRRGEGQINLLDLFAGLIKDDRGRHAGTLGTLFDNGKIDFDALIIDAVKQALNRSVNRIDPPVAIPESMAGRDLSWECRQGTILHKTGFEALLGDAMRVLFKRERNSLIICANQGIGRTTALEQIALYLNSGKQAGRLKKKVLLFNCAALFPERKKSFLDDVLHYAAGKDNVILCLDGVEALFEGDENKIKHYQRFIQQFQYALLRDNMQFILMITPDAFQGSFHQDNKIKRLFEIAELKEPSFESTEKILAEVLPGLAKKYKVTFAEAAVRSAMHLTEQYMLSEYYPQKAIRVLEEAADASSASALGKTDEVIVDLETILKAVADFTGMPVEMLRGDPGETDYAVPLSERVFGQNFAVQVCANELAMIKSGIKNPEKPASVMLFAGLTGTGKTEMAKTIANIYSASKRLVTFTMENFGEAHSVSGIIGVPPGYVGAENGGPLVNEINKDPYCVVLFDEIEKAHPDVIKAFLHLFDEGWLVDTLNRRAVANRSIFILTSNVGAEEISRLYRQGATREEVEEAVKAALFRAKFRETSMTCFTPEFLARIQQIVIFNPLDHESLLKIIGMELDKKTALYLKTRNKKLSIDDRVRHLLADEALRRYEASAGREGGRIAHKIIVQYIDTLIQRCPPQQFKLADGIRIAGAELPALRLEFLYGEMKSEEASEAIDKYLAALQVQTGDYLKAVLEKYNHFAASLQQLITKNVQVEPTEMARITGLVENDLQKLRDQLG